MRQITRLIEQPATNAHWQEAAKLREVVWLGLLRERLGWESQSLRSHLELSEQMSWITMVVAESRSWSSLPGFWAQMPAAEEL
jgi:hypothetical protein